MLDLRAVSTLLSRGAVALLVLGTIASTGCCFPFPVAQLEGGFGFEERFFDARQYHGPTWTADGHSILFESSHQTEISQKGKTFTERRDNIFTVKVSSGELSVWESDDAPNDGDGGEHYDATHELSHDGTRIAFATLRHGYDGKSSEIATANLDGSDYRRLTESEGVDISPSWSPDGSLVAFASNRDQHLSYDDEIGVSHYGIYVMEASGENVRRLAPTVYVRPRPPVWSPDGKWLAFMGDWDRNLYTVSVDGDSVNNLGDAFPFLRRSRNSIQDEFSPTPAWSPDSLWLAYVIKAGSGFDAIVISKSNWPEAEVREIFRAPREPGLGNLSWSPDGLILRFTASLDLDMLPETRYLAKALYEIGIDGSNRRRIAGVESGARIDWSPDDSRIAVFLSSRRPPPLAKRWFTRFPLREQTSGC